MSYAVDVNLLLYASDESSPRQSAAREFLQRCSTGSELLFLAWNTLMSYVRIATHPGIFARPLTPDAALANIENLISLPQTRLMSEKDGFLEVYSETTGSFVARGNLVPDAHLATLLKQHGVSVLYSSDRDFQRFEFLELRDPFNHS